MSGWGQAVGNASIGSDFLSSIENVIASDYGDVLVGDGANNVLNGGGGDDTLMGGLGDDNDPDLSPHLRSRHETALLLRSQESLIGPAKRRAP